MSTVSEATSHPIDPVAPTTGAPIVPVPLSFPAVLRNPGLNSRFAHLHRGADSEGRPAPAPVSTLARREDREGKRWVRRKENARFVGNPHIAAPTKRDYAPVRPTAHPTFPVPLPPYLPRNVALPHAVPPPISPDTANAGRFSLSTRGMRRTLRKAGPRTQALVKAVEDEIVRWLSEGGVVLQPDGTLAAGYEGLQFPGRAIGEQQGVREVERSPLKLVWWIEDDAWARYVVHCCARYYEVVSFSNDTSTHRLTHLLRPNVSRPDHAARAALMTPPATDLDLSSLSSYDSDILSSLSDINSDATHSDALSESENGGGPLSDIASDHQPLSDIASDAGAEADVERERAEERPHSPASVGSIYRGSMQDADAWSVDGDSELDRAIDALSIQDSPVSSVFPGTTNQEETPRLRHGATYRRRMWDRNTRSASSPSRSPARRGPRRRMDTHILASTVRTGKAAGKGERSFYEYLFD